MKDFYNWYLKKNLIDSYEKTKNVFYHEREVWWGNLGLNIGVETDGKNIDFERPVLIIKKFNGDMVWILPITTSIKKNKYYYPINHIVINGSVILSQIRTVSTKRLSRKFGMVSKYDFKNITSQIVLFIYKDQKPPCGSFFGGRSH